MAVGRMFRRTRKRETRWLERLLGPTEAEVGCDECFDRLDRYVELEATGVDVASRFPMMRAHLEGCPACKEEHDELLAFIKPHVSGT